MHIHVARELVNRIDAHIKKDGGASFRGWLGKVLPHIGDAYRTEEEDGFRSHLGASILGGDCPRDIWYSFRWALKPDFEGRMLRLFNRGHMEEGRFIALLLMVGAKVFQQDSEGKQFRITFAEGHGGGSGDGIIQELQELGDTPALAEFKTHSEKSFIEIAGGLQSWRNYLAGKGNFEGKGVRAVKFEHYVQMQLYMRKMGYAVAVYFAINKNTDDIYIEFVPLDENIADQFISRGENLVYAQEPPKKLNESPGFWKCRFCNHKGPCHSKTPVEKNCRTCQYSEARKDGEGTWFCTLAEMKIEKSLQLTGCDSYEVAKVFAS